MSVACHLTALWFAKEQLKMHKYTLGANETVSLMVSKERREGAKRETEVFLSLPTASTPT